jgi:hypothetical protein
MLAWLFLVKLIGTHPALGKIKTKTKIDWVSAFNNLALIEFLFFPFFFFFFFFFLRCYPPVEVDVYFVLLLLVVIGIISFIFPFNVHI